MENINVSNEIKDVGDELMKLDMDILNAAREEVKRKCGIKDTVARVFAILIFLGLLISLMAFSKNFLGYILGIFACFGVAKIVTDVISEVTNNSIKNKCDDLPELRRFAEKLAKKNPELKEKLKNKEEKQRILNYLNEQLAKKEQGKKVEFTPIDKVAPGELRGPQELVDVLIRIRNKKEIL